MYVEFQVENLNGKDHLGDLSIDGGILKAISLRECSGFIWLRTGTSGGLL
jgi:hypothetical protein